jgi:hypothetical protein
MNFSIDDKELQTQTLNNGVVLILDGEGNEYQISRKAIQGDN